MTLSQVEYDCDTENSDKKEENENVQSLTHTVSSTSTIMDYRMLWIRNKVMMFLNLSNNYQLFDDLLHENESYKQKLLNFFLLDTYDVSNLDKKVIFFYKTYRNETIQEEISVWEESHRTKIKALVAFTSKIRSHRLTKSAPGNVEKFEEDKFKSKKGKKGKKSKGKTDKNEVSSSTTASIITGVSSTAVSAFESDEGETEIGAENWKNESRTEMSIMNVKEKGQSRNDSSFATPSFTPAPGEEDKYILTKKVVEKVVQVPELHMFFGRIDSGGTNVMNQKIVYFVRIGEKDLPPFDSIEECNAYLPNYVDFGSLNGNFVWLNQILTQVYKPLVELEFKVPRIFKHQAGEKPKSLPRENVAATINKILNTQTYAFTQPSNFVNIPSIEEKHKERSKTVNESGADNAGQINSTARFKCDYSLPLDITEKSDKYEPLVDTFKNDLLKGINSLTAAIEWTLEHVDTDLLLIIPKIYEVLNTDITDEMLCEDKNIIKQLEETVLLWEKHIKKVLHSYETKVQQRKGPLAEYDYWHDREIGLSTLVEQLKTPTIRRILLILDRVKSPVISMFTYSQDMLHQQYKEARDNRQFLSILRRYFQIIEESELFESIIAVFPTLMLNCKIIWVLSKHYSKEEKMVQLLERVSWQLCQNVKNILALDNLFKINSLETILHKTKYGSVMLQKWKMIYLHTRKDIEMSRKGMRWEFDKRRLFRETDYIAIVCCDLHMIASVLQDFFNIFGSELKSIVNDPTQVDDMVTRIHKLTDPIQEADFDAFVTFNKENWEAMIKYFNSEVSHLEDVSVFFIDECFTDLVNAKEALNILLKLKNIKTRKTIQKQLQRKFQWVMQHFSKEVNMIEDIFKRKKNEPSVLLNYPHTGGAVFWARQLLNRLKGPVIGFENTEQLKDSDMKVIIFEQYLSVAKEIEYYEENILNEWINRASAIVFQTMKSNVIKMKYYEQVKMQKVRTEIHQDTTNVKQLNSKEILKSFSGSQDICQKTDINLLQPYSEVATERYTADKLLPEGAKNKSVFTTLKKNQMQKVTWSETMHDSLLVDHNLRFQINFNEEVFNIIREAEIIQTLGCELPTVITDVVNQKNRLFKVVKAVQQMINRFNDIDQLDDAELRLLRNVLLSIKRHILPGMMRYNWHSLCIEDYASSCEKLLKDLASMNIQINQIKKILDRDVIEKIASFDFLGMKENIVSLEHHLEGYKMYFLRIQRQRTEDVDIMLKAYKSVTPMLKKLESLIEGTSSGTSLSMQLLYEQYEQKIFMALLRCLHRNLIQYLRSLQSDNKALFEVDAILVATNVLLKPSPDEIKKTIMHDVYDVVSRMKNFRRWKKGTCLECQQVSSETESMTLTFFDNIINIQMINDLVCEIENVTDKLAFKCWMYVQKWKPYGHLWIFDKKQICKKFLSERPTLMEYDKKLSVYRDVIDKVSKVEQHIDINSIRINLTPLVKEVEAHAAEWIRLLGNHLLKETLQSMNDLKKYIETCNEEVNLVISGLDRFKRVMQTISDIKKMTIQAEVQYLSYQETFRILRTYHIQFTQDNETLAYKLQKDWESLYLVSHYRITTLESTKDRFRDMTKEHISRFCTEFHELARDYELNGPGSIRDDFKLGIKKMEEYGKIIQEMEEKRLDLVQSEILFDISPTNYSIFLQVKKQHKYMELIYELYETQKKTRESWANTLWINLNPQELQNGIEHFLKEFRKLPKDARQLPIAQALEASMKMFKNSVVLFVELKNEAMRERHWKKLMEQTGVYFDISPERFGKDS